MGIMLIYIYTDSEILILIQIQVYYCKIRLVDFK